jgi:hypothetical protein
MQPRRDRLWRIGLMVSALAALLVLAASLSTPTLGPGWTAANFWFSSQGGSPSELGLRLGQILIGAGLILMLTLAVANILLASRRRRPRSGMNFSMLGVVLTVLIIAVLRPDVLERLRLSPAPAASSAATPASTASTPPIPAALPEALAYAVSLMAAVAVVLSAWVVWRVLRRRQLPDQGTVAQQAAQVAHTALADWQSGSPLATVIIRCYREMSDLVAEKRAMQRAADMTPREFVGRLEKAGVPARPVQELTALFELARYSSRPLGAPEEAAARACLKALAEALETPA